jgi:hypothetical protein
MKKPVLAMFVVAAIAIGLLIMLLVGVLTVNEDGRTRDDAGRPAATDAATAGYQAG